MDYTKFIGMHIWVPGAGEVDAEGHNAKICWVHEASTPNRICVNALGSKGNHIIQSLYENLDFFWERPVTSRPFVEKQIFVNVYKERDGRYTTGAVHLDGESARVQAEGWGAHAHLITLTGTIVERK